MCDTYFNDQLIIFRITIILITQVRNAVECVCVCVCVLHGKQKICP